MSFSADPFVDVKGEPRAGVAADTTEQVRDFMLRFQRDVGRPPTQEEISKEIPALQYRSSAKYVLDRMVDNGLAERIGEPGQHASVRALEHPREMPLHTAFGEEDELIQITSLQAREEVR